ncbi:Glycerophosphocholine permease GIT4 [Fulvia fulva]|uniref:Glycerophosphocholine permease GIT4 n=1 Tax=Passalora fulva TaxID=5499 RepID=A0A9Q8PHE2_PASFU|nr:Glycerophosphocholine permease GIT4 [Fulvia fulva]KAK4615575.1 Glycerophosphocholine permease GIT4 [Fulvia fulva]KAK4616413.1 Glycerophosphocholine permease GIT4 [Fulvia fulva]UJO22474.1 Glycerophosphocholine permease GIT4 [Fulvia fulva]WPV19330.1 Glycerophosphocholine permease GIT4 [Fulvia fulva]WPV34141.1 Glycerophosphocholine permease GIT4 [Fulvia fulva]
MSTKEVPTVIEASEDERDSNQQQSPKNGHSIIRNISHFSTQGEIDAGTSRWKRAGPTIACGAGLFSDGYLQSVIGAVNTCLSRIYGTQYTSSSFKHNVSSIAFAGTVVGQLVFGYTSDNYSRKWSLVVSTIILFIFAALCAGSYGAGGSAQGLFAALTAYRFLLGIGIGGEYPAGSVGCAENTAELKAGHRNRWFCMFTNVQIDLGFVVGSIVPMVLARMASNNLGLVWRLSLGLGVIPPLILLYFRVKLKEPEVFARESLKRIRTPYWLVVRYYGPRLCLVAGIWFIYDFLTYPFSIYSSAWISVIQPDAALWQTFGWSTLVNFFYLPGAVLGAFLSDWMGPRRALFTFVIAQGVVGFTMSACYGHLKEPRNIAAFVVVYGIFLALGEMGPGNNIGLIASKTCSTGVRGRYYAVAAATGKIGAFIGNYIFPYIVEAGGGEDTVRGGQYPFYVASSLCFLSAFLTWWLPTIDQSTIEKEDLRFREYLEAHGFDTTTMGQ